MLLSKSHGNIRSNKALAHPDAPPTEAGPTLTTLHHGSVV